MTPARSPLIFIATSLILLLLVPPLVAWQTQRIRNTIAVYAEPARQQNDLIQYGLAVEISDIRGYLMTGDQSYLADARSAHDALRAALTDLQGYAEHLGPRVTERVENLVAAEERWFRAVDELLSGRLDAAGYLALIPAQDALYREVLRSSVQIGAVITRVSQENRQRIRSLERWAAVLTVSLSLLALISTVLLARLGRTLDSRNQEIRSRLADERRLREVSQVLASTFEPSSLLQQIVDGARTAARATAAQLERVDFGRAEVEVAAVSGQGHTLVGLRVPYPGSLAEDVIRKGEPELIRDVGAANRPISVHLAKTCGQCSALVVPLVSEGDALGALLLLRPLGEPDFSKEEISRAWLMGDLGAVALRRVLLYEEAVRYGEQLESSERSFRLLVEGVQDHAIFMLDDNGLIASWNAGAERMLGYSADEVVGQPVTIFLSEDDREESPIQRDLFVATRQGRYLREGFRVRKDGSRFWAESILTPVRSASGDLHGYAAIVRDVSERRAIESARLAALEQARVARHEAEFANRAKSQFLANMSHEIRTPINAIVGFSDLLDMEIAGPLNSEQRQHLSRIQASSEHLLGLVNDILDLSKIEAGEMRVTTAPTRLRATARMALSMVEPQATAKGIELSDRSQCPEELTYVGDEDRVRQVLLNLLSNAVKFTAPAGRVEMCCRVTAETAPEAKLPGIGPWAAIDIADTGIGIAPEDSQRVFEPFVQLEAGYTRSSTGTGLGLAISRRLARLMGGDITVRSAPGQGSTFTLWLPTHIGGESEVPSA